MSDAESKLSAGGWTGHTRGYSRTESGFSAGGFSQAPLVPEGKSDELESEAPPLEKPVEEMIVQEQDADGNIYPGTFGLTILVIGLCLSVFLISLDRTIITTVSLASLLNFTLLTSAGDSFHHI